MRRAVPFPAAFGIFVRAGALLVVTGLLSCGHAAQKPASRPVVTPPAPPPPDPLVVAAELSTEAHALLRTEGDLLWKRWTTGGGALPAGALAAHPRLVQRESLEQLSLAIARSAAPEAAALKLLRAELGTLALAHETAAETEALERARAGLSFAAPGAEAGADRPLHGERDLDKLLSEEPAAGKRALLALAEAKAAQPLAQLPLERDLAQAKALAALGLGDWTQFATALHGASPAELAGLAERTLQATEAAAVRAVAGSAERNLGITPERLRRADLPRLVRSAASDAQFPAGRAWPRVQTTLATLGIDPGLSSYSSQLRASEAGQPGPSGKLLVDAEPSPSKGARPLALLVDPPQDVRLSLRPAGGFEEQRALLHEGARAIGGTLTATPRWELAQLGDGTAAEGVAQLFEELAGDPAWLREATELRGEPLDDLVHTQATRRLLSARRAAALVLFETRRREGPNTAQANATLYRGLLQRATLALLTDEDAGRWALESDGWIRAATALQGALAAAQLEQALKKTGATWWHAPASGALLRKIWAQGRSGTATALAQLLGAQGLDPAALAAAAEAQLSYLAPEAPPPTQRPDYKFMQGDRRVQKKKKHQK